MLYAHSFKSVAILGLILIAGCASPKRSVPAPVPDRLAEMLRQGEQAETRGEGAEAAKIYEAAVRDFPDYSVSWSHLGEYRRFWAHDPEGAIEAFHKAANAPQATAESVAFAYRGWGEVERSRGRISKALGLFEESLRHKPLADTHRSLSALYATEKRDFEKAAHHAKAAVDLSPEDPIALVQYAVQMARFKKFEESEEAFWKAMGIAGCDERGRSNGLVHCCILYNGACYHAVRGNKADALAMLKEFFSTPNHRHITREEIVRDPDFESLVKDPDFKALLDYRLPEE
ncbi:MAG TPA: tetratricopeptide repeat protein [Planctomycetota bacterium]|nr:tetratricopeptide repeat protein [Planctomycetota bacterium]